MKKIVAGLSIIFATMITLTGCGTSSGEELPVSSDIKDSQSVVKELNNAQEITLKKKPISVGDHWTVSADGKTVAEIEGEVFYMFGDTYSMFSNNENLVGLETEEFLVADRGSKTYDYNGEQRGHIDQKIISVGYDFSIYENDKKVGKVRQKLSLGLQADVKNTNDKVEYSVKKSVFSIGSEIIVKKESTNKEPKIDAIDVVWASVMMSEIHDADSDSSK